MPAMTDLTLTQILRRYSACPPAIEWSDAFGTNLRSAWDQCERGDWLLWIASMLDVKRQTMVYASCQCARLALVHVKFGDKRPRKAIETAEAWCRGEATIEDVKAAKEAAYAAYAVYLNIAPLAAFAAYAAYAAASTTSDDFYDDIDDSASAAAFNAATASATEEATLKQCAELVRETISFDVIQDALSLTA